LHVEHQRLYGNHYSVLGEFHPDHVRRGHGVHLGHGSVSGHVEALRRPDRDCMHDAARLLLELS
jgi:hypothetical protein